MIEFTKSYKTQDGQVFGTIEDAQLHELSGIFDKNADVRNGAAKPLNRVFAQIVLDNKSVLIDILTTTPNSKPKARSVHGGTKNRKRTVVTDAATSVTSVANSASDSATTI